MMLIGYKEQKNPLNGANYVIHTTTKQTCKVFIRASVLKKFK